MDATRDDGKSCVGPDGNPLYEYEDISSDEDPVTDKRQWTDWLEEIDGDQLAYYADLCQTSLKTDQCGNVSTQNSTLDYGDIGRHC